MRDMVYWRSKPIGPEPSRRYRCGAGPVRFVETLFLAAVKLSSSGARVLAAPLYCLRRTVYLTIIAWREGKWARKRIDDGNKVHGKHARNKSV